MVTCSQQRVKIARERSGSLVKETLSFPPFRDFATARETPSRGRKEATRRDRRIGALERDRPPDILENDDDGGKEDRER